MPDLPLDTLVIIGLVLASLIGRIFQKSKTLTRARQKPRQIKLPTPTNPRRSSQESFWEPEIVEEFEDEEFVAVGKTASKGSNPKSSIFPRPLRPSQLALTFLCRKRNRPDSCTEPWEKGKTRTF